MKLWIYHHRKAIKNAYCFLVLTTILVLQILEAQGVIR